MKISNKLTEINKVLLLINMKDSACHISVIRADLNRIHIEYYGFDGDIDQTWAFSQEVIGIEAAIKEVLTFKYYENQEELKEEITKGYEAEEGELCTIEEWFGKWGF